MKSSRKDRRKALNHQIIVNIVFILMFIGFSLGLAKRIPSFAGPYRVIIRKLLNETDEFNSTEKVWADLHLTHPRLRQLQYFWGSSVNQVDLDDTIRVEARISTWANNQWKRNAFLMKFDHACSDAQKYGGKLLPFYFGDDGKKCPVGKGSRTIRNQTVDFVFPALPVFPYGHWLFTVAIFKGNEVVGVHMAEFETVPRL